MTFPRVLRSWLTQILLDGYQVLYLLLRSALFTLEAGTSHKVVQDLLARWDLQDNLQFVLQTLTGWLHPDAPVEVGGVTLPQPYMLAAGWIKGEGHDNEVRALAAVVKDSALLPGWRTLPHLVGPVEFGSYTRWPRHGNTGVTMWRLRGTSSLGNRVGLKNAGIRAVASFLSLHKSRLPACYGINVAVTPGVEEPRQLRKEMAESLAYLFDAGIAPTWLTLNVSCPSHAEDPSLHQTEEVVRTLLQVARLETPVYVPIWIKVSPGLPASQYRLLLNLCDEFGIKAIVATNSLQQVDPDGTHWGLGGGALVHASRQALIKLVTLKRIHGHAVDIIACGGILTGQDLKFLRQLDIRAWQYQSALVYRGPLAAALIYREAHPDTL